MSGQHFNQPQTIRVLLVDDDAVVLRVYQERLTQQGLQVATAADGLAAISALRTGKPDLIVLDLMMPKLSGVDVLKFIRSQPGLEGLPVVVLSNAYMNQLAAEAAELGVQSSLLKIRCSPALLIATIRDVLAGKSASRDPSLLLGTPKEATPAPLESTPKPPPTAPPPPRSPPPPVAPAVRAPREPSPPAAAVDTTVRHSFLQNTAATAAAVRSLAEAFARAPNAAARELHLQSLYRKTHFLAASAGLAGCHHLAQMASAFEALLFELIGRPAAITPSVLRTISATVDFLGFLLERPHGPESDVPLHARVLVVDDDALNNRLVVAALQRAHLHVRSTDDPFVALQLLQENRFDLVLLDIEMPGMDGFELCRRLRTLPGYQSVPVIYVTFHSDFETHARGDLGGGDDLISKPVFPLDLAVKAVTHLLKRRLSPS